MSGIFLTPLRAEKVKEAGNASRAKWKLTESFSYYSDYMILRYDIAAGFETDFASVPRIPFAHFLTGDTAHASAVVHDYLVRIELPQKRITWNQAARVFDEAMKAEGVPGWRRFLMFNAVRLSGVFK